MRRFAIGAAVAAAATLAWKLRDRIAGLARRARPVPDYNDQTLKAKVESELFRAAEAPKGQVAVNAQHGIVQLRGEVDSPELIDELVARTQSVSGVREVENLLHLPGSPAPMHQ